MPFDGMHNLSGTTLFNQRRGFRGNYVLDAYCCVVRSGWAKRQACDATAKAPPLGRLKEDVNPAENNGVTSPGSFLGLLNKNSPC